MTENLTDLDAYSVSQNRYVQLTAMLVYYGANTYIPNNQGRSPRDISTGYQGYATDWLSEGIVLEFSFSALCKFWTFMIEMVLRD